MRLAAITVLILSVRQVLSAQPGLTELRGQEKFNWQVDSLSPRLSIYYQPGSSIDGKMEKVRKKVLSQIDSVLEFMGLDDYRPRIHLFVVESRSQMKDLIGWETNGSAFFKENVVTGITSTIWSIYSTHEFFHTIATNVWGVPDLWLNEGMAVYCDKNWNGYDFHQLAKFLVDKKKYISIQKLIKNLRKENSSISYPLLGSFVRYLDETYGRDLILKIWKGKTRKLKRETKKTIQKLEKEWLIKISKESYENINY